MSKLSKGVLVETVKIPKLNLCDWDFRVGPISKFSNDELESIYQLFENVWALTMRELTGVNTYFSDSFLNAQEIGVIYFKGEPVAIHLYNIYDLDFSLNHKRSIFGSLNTNCMQKLREYGKRVLSLESFTVGPTVRKDTSVGVHVAKVLCALGSHILQTRNADFISGITFNKRKVNEITEEQNYILVEQD